MDKIREVLCKYCIGIYGEPCRAGKERCLHSVEAPKEMLPKEKLTYEHREIKIGNRYVKEVDARYNAGYNDCLQDIRAKIEELKG